MDNADYSVDELLERAPADTCTRTGQVSHGLPRCRGRCQVINDMMTGQSVCRMNNWVDSDKSRKHPTTLDSNSKHLLYRTYGTERGTEWKVMLTSGRPQVEMWRWCITKLLAHQAFPTCPCSCPCPRSTSSCASACDHCEDPRPPFKAIQGRCSSILLFSFNSACSGSDGISGASCGAGECHTKGFSSSSNTASTCGTDMVLRTE